MPITLLHDMTHDGEGFLLFWLCLTIICYTFLGYPLGVYLAARRCRKPDATPGAVDLPSITVVLAAYNEEHRIISRVQNLLNSDYPVGKLDVFIVSDGSTDTTVERVRALNDSRIQIVAQPQRTGKAACLNVGIAAACGEIVVFTDVRQHFAPNSIQELAKHFTNPQIGAVSGELEIASADSGVGAGVDAYWRLEKFIRLNEARRDSCIGCTGAVYAIRRKLFQPIPADTLLDDVVIPMQIALQKYRVIFEPNALAYDPQPLEPDMERVRKQRTLAGNYQMLFRHPQWLLPWRNRLWWQLVSHKYLRLAAPFFMLGLFAANAALIAQPFYRLLFSGQCLFYMVALIGITFPAKRHILVSAPAGFVFLNFMALLGLGHYLFSQRRTGWKTVPLREQKASSNV